MRNENGGKEEGVLKPIEVRRCYEHMVLVYSLCIHSAVMVMDWCISEALHAEGVKIESVVIDQGSVDMPGPDLT